MMSRRKQLNPKPLNKGDCSDSTEDMTVDSRDSKDFNTNNIMDENDHHHMQQEQPSNDDHRSSPAAIVNRLTKETEHKMPAESPNHSDMGDLDDNEPPKQKRPKMELESHLRKTPDCLSMQPTTPSAVHANETSKPDEDDNLASTQMDETNSKDRRSCSPGINSPSISPAKSEDAVNERHSSSSSPSQAMPKLRLNTLLASDPALMPDAKDLKVVHESQSQQRKQRLQQQQQQQERERDIDASSPHRSSSITKLEPLMKPQPTPPLEVAPRMKVFMCLPCGIGFSSPSTLEAHQSFYCSHRHKENVDDDTGASTALNDKASHSPSQASAAIATSSSTGSGGGSESAAKIPKTGKQYACTQCSYSADKKVSLNRHMRMHQTSPAPSSNSNNNGGVTTSGSGHMEENSSQQIDRYCSDCDIRFNNVKTYRAHKQHYCSSRRTEGQLTPKLEVSTTPSTPKANSVHSGAMSPQTRTKTPTPAMVAAAAAAAAALQQPSATPFLALPTNPILIIPYSLIRSASLIAGPLETAPLDLSLRRSPIAALLQKQRLNSAASFLDAAAAVEHQQRLDMETLLEAGKENLAIDDAGSITPEQIVCAPSLPNSPSMSPSPRRRAISPRSSGAGSTSSMSPPATIPPGASNSANIFENFHLRSLLPAELLNPLLANKNLELALKLSAAASTGGHNENVYKCPLCDAVSLTASESRKHMETHGTVKAFRCTICRYKGNTLRGMRTHIRMHFDKKSTDLNEEHFMACILEDESIEIPSAASLNQEHLVQQQQKHLQQQVAAAAAVAAGLQQQQQQQSQQQQVFNCDICNYSSTYKGNVLRHMKLVHPHIITNSPSISPEAGDLETAETNSLSGSLNGDNGINTFAIKSEPVDHATANAPTTPVVLLNPHDNNNSPIPSIGQHPVHANDLMHHIKSEPMEISIEPPTGPMMSITPTLRSPAIGPPPPLNATPEENVNNQKYCQTCDISFNYMKTYLAHKQFYCKNKMRRPETNDSPSPNAGVLVSAAAVPSPNSLMMQKNKENLQQEAAI
uniref:Zinc finger protein ush n=1 Tax=Stomoxys calcitrans TaxID=35570 RepID=A0A1I8NX40_STOCA